MHPIASTSRSLTKGKRNYVITELETLAVVWAIRQFVPYLYGHEVTVYTDHSAIKAVLKTPNPSGKHTKWWTCVYGIGVKNVSIRYQPGQQNFSADALSRSPQAPSSTFGVGQDESQVATVTTNASNHLPDNPALLNVEPENAMPDSFAREQQKDSDVQEIIEFLESEQLLYDQKRACKIALQASLFTIDDQILYYINPKQKHQKRVVVLSHVRKPIL